MRDRPPRRYLLSVRSSLRPPLLDAALAGALAVAVLAEAAMTETTRTPAVHAVVGVAVVAGLAWRRRYPLPVLLLAVAGVFVLDPMNQFSVLAALVIASYTAGACLDPPHSWVALAFAVGSFWIAFAVGGGVPSDFVLPTVFYGGPWLIGRLSRDRARRADEFAERAATLEREQEEAQAAAVAAERARIARELHDIVAHSISVIVVQTQAVRRRLDPAQVREAEDLSTIELTARQAMDEMRRLFGVLRAYGEPASLAPQPGLDQLDRLLAETRAAGLVVDLSIEGDPVPLPPGVDLAAYRIVQEALTNVRKHAGTDHAGLTLDFRDHELHVVVVDDGRADATTSARAGYGLVGMRERVSVYGGMLETGRSPGGGFAVRATLPFRQPSSV